MPEPSHRLILDFWGLTVDVTVPQPADLDHLEFYFRDYTRAASRPAIMTIHLRTDDGSGFVAAIGDAAIGKAIYVDHGRGPELYEQFWARANKPTPLPPFCFEPLTSQVAVSHGAVVACGSPTLRACVIRGASCAGKSTLTLALLQAGASFVSDDLVITDREGWLLRYTRPIGVRERTLALFPNLRRAVEASARALGTATGRTWMARPEQLGCKPSPWRVRPAWEIELTGDEHFDTEMRGPTQLSITWSPERHLGPVLDLLNTLEVL